MVRAGGGSMPLGLLYLVNGNPTGKLRVRVSPRIGSGRVGWGRVAIFITGRVRVNIIGYGSGSCNARPACPYCIGAKCVMCYLLKISQIKLECTCTLEIQVGADSLTLTLSFDLLKPKSVGCEKNVEWLLLCQVSSHSDRGYIPIHPTTYIHTPRQDKLIAISVPHCKMQWRRSVIKSGVHGQSGQAIKLFRITPYVNDFQTINNPGSWQCEGGSKN